MDSEVTAHQSRELRDTWNPLLHTPKYYGRAIGWIVASLLCFTIAAFAAYRAFDDLYPNLASLTCAVIAAALGILGLIQALSPRAIIVYADRLELLSIRTKNNRTIRWEDIESWCEKEEKVRGQIVRWIVLRQRRRKLKLSSTTYERDYDALLSLFKDYAGRAEDSMANNGELSYPALGGLASAGVVIVLLAYNTWSKGLNPISQSELASITGAIAHDGTIYKGTKGARYIDIRLTGLQDWRFFLDVDAYEATDKPAYVNSVRRGDTINIGIAKDEYHKKLVGDIPLTLWEKLADYRDIRVFSITGRKQAYLTLEAYNLERSDTFLSGCSMMFGILVILVAFIMLFHKLGYPSRG